MTYETKLYTRRHLKNFHKPEVNNAVKEMREWYALALSLERSPHYFMIVLYANGDFECSSRYANLRYGDVVVSPLEFIPHCDDIHLGYLYRSANIRRLLRTHSAKRR